MSYTGLCIRFGIFNGRLYFINRSFRLGIDHGRIRFKIRFNGRCWLLDGGFFPFDVGNVLNWNGNVFLFRNIIRRNGRIIAASLEYGRL